MLEVPLTIAPELVAAEVAGAGSPASSGSPAGLFNSNTQPAPQPAARLRVRRAQDVDAAALSLFAGAATVTVTQYGQGDAGVSMSSSGAVSVSVAALPFESLALTVAWADEDVVNGGDTPLLRTGVILPLNTLDQQNTPLGTPTTFRFDAGARAL